MNTRLLLISLVAACGLATLASADDICCEPATTVLPVAPVVYVAPAEPSWIFMRSTFTHDPTTGARVAQYMRKPPVEPLDDQRAVTSRYRRTRSVIRGPHGSYDTTYQVQAWGNNGGIDAQWQAFHDAWKESILSGGFYNSNFNFNGPVGPWRDGRGFPPFGPGWSGWNGWGNGWNGWNGGPQGGWNHGNGPHDGHHNPHDHWPNDDDHWNDPQD
jgi:hypothetical protein